MLEIPECEENAFDGLHCPRWYGGGRCSYCGATQPRTLNPAEELAAAKADPEGRELSPAAQALYEQEGAARFAEIHGGRNRRWEWLETAPTVGESRTGHQVNGDHSPMVSGEGQEQ